MADDEATELVMTTFKTIGYYYTTSGDAPPDNSYKSFVTSLPRERRVIYLTVAADGQINNGGFHQYFYNSTGYFAPETATAFDEIGSPQRANLMRRAIERIFSEQEMQFRIRRERTLESFFASYKETQLGELDDAYYETERTIPLYPLLARYIRTHGSAFESD